jgi:hypothetical protein
VSFAEDHEFYGAETSLYLDAPMALLFEFQRLGEATGQEAESIMRKFGDLVLIDWNLEDDNGQAIPATGEGMLTQPFPFAVALIEAWGKAAAEPSTPLVPA